MGHRGDRYHPRSRLIALTVTRLNRHPIASIANLDRQFSGSSTGAAYPRNRGFAGTNETGNRTDPKIKQTLEHLILRG
jgi:hypothetical protein